MTKPATERSDGIAGVMVRQSANQAVILENLAVITAEIAATVVVLGPMLRQVLQELNQSIQPAPASPAPPPPPPEPDPEPVDAERARQGAQIWLKAIRDRFGPAAADAQKGRGSSDSKWDGRTHPDGNTRPAR